MTTIARSSFAATGAAWLPSFLDASRVGEICAAIAEFRPVRAQEEIGAVAQRAEMATMPFDPRSAQTALATLHADVRTVLERVLGDSGEAWRATEMTLMHYRDCSDGISPHRDHLRYRTAVVVVSLAGEARFEILADREARNPIKAFHCRPGDLVVLRAPVSPTLDDRPFHAVRNLSSQPVTS